jgi:hypothetical protein
MYLLSRVAHIHLASPLICSSYWAEKVLVFDTCISCGIRIYIEAVVMKVWLNGQGLDLGPGFLLGYLSTPVQIFLV